MVMDGVTLLLLVISTWQAYFAVPSCLEDSNDSRKWMTLTWLWLSLKLMWCVMFPILLGTWHRIAVIRRSAAHHFTSGNNLEQDVSLKSEVAKNWRARYSVGLLHKVVE